MMFTAWQTQQGPGQFCGILQPILAVDRLWNIGSNKSLDFKNKVI